MKKILIVANHFYPYVGGLEKFALELSNGLAKKGNKVDVLTFQYKQLKEFEKKNNINIIRLPCFEILGDTYSIPKVFSFEYKKLRKKILNEKYDVVITNTRFFTSTFIGLKLAQKMKSKFIHIEHGNKFVTHKNPIVTIAAWIYDQTLGRFVISKANLVVGISKKCVSFSKKLGAKKTTTIHNSIHTSQFSKIKSEKNKKTTITYVGRLIYAKGIQHIIEAVKGKDYVLNVVGEGPYKKELEKLSFKLKVKVNFLGQKNQKEIIKILSESDIFVNPSYSEGLPTSVLEAGAIGLPIIATDVGGTNEIIDDGINGILIKSKSVDEIKKALKKLENKKLRSEFSKKIKEKVKNNFDWTKTIEKFENIIEE
ncbi:glycosyltransferase family 4 protein [Candidatus Woesearchaeota archaeon]|nr:glycosyltransferase family 4 protein [Candidatus Woesearchaeota archaeon]